MNSRASQSTSQSQRTKTRRNPQAIFLPFDPALLTEAQAAAYLGYKPETLRDHRNRGHVGYMKFAPDGDTTARGRSVRYTRRQLDAFIKEYWVDCPPVHVHTNNRNSGNQGGQG